MKTARRQSVGPAQQGATQPARNVAVDDEAPSKMKGLSLSVLLLAHRANAPAPKVLRMDKIQEVLPNFVPIVCHFCGFGL